MQCVFGRRAVRWHSSCNNNNNNNQWNEQYLSIVDQCHTSTVVGFFLSHSIRFTNIFTRFTFKLPREHTGARTLCRTRTKIFMRNNLMNGGKKIQFHNTLKLNGRKWTIGRNIIDCVGVCVMCALFAPLFLLRFILQWASHYVRFTGPVSISFFFFVLFVGMFPFFVSFSLTLPHLNIIMIHD